MVSLDTFGRCFSRYLSLPAIASGDCPSSKFCSINFFNCQLFTIFLPRKLALCLRTYVFCWALVGSYFPLTEFLFISSEIVETDLIRTLAISLCEYFLRNKIAISLRSFFDTRVYEQVFFHDSKINILFCHSNTGVRIEMRI